MPHPEGTQPDENCTFCHTADMRHIDDSADRIEWKIDRAKRLGYSMVVLSGGEPTMRPELLRWAKRVAAHGLDFGLVRLLAALAAVGCSAERPSRSHLSGKTASSISACRAATWYA